jgi:hypothetical protein
MARATGKSRTTYTQLDQKGKAWATNAQQDLPDKGGHK